MRRMVVMFVWLGFLGSALPAASAWADEADPGHRLYLRYCASCHGSSAKGDGEVAAVLTPKPSDLTQIARKNGGKFDAFTVYQQIEGRPPVAHGSREMPVWGEVLRAEPGGAGDPGGADPRAVELKLVKIVEYLRSVQAQ